MGFSGYFPRICGPRVDAGLVGFHDASDPDTLFLYQNEDVFYAANVTDAPSTATPAVQTSIAHRDVTGIPATGTGSGDFSLAFLVYTTGANSGGYMLGHYGGQYDWSVRQQSGTDYTLGIVYGVSSSSNGSTNLSLDTWHHLVIVVTDNTTDRDIDVYLDGNATPEISVAAAANPSLTNPHLTLGNYTPGGAIGFMHRGMIRSVLGITRALNTAEIAALKTATIG